MGGSPIRVLRVVRDTVFFPRCCSVGVRVIRAKGGVYGGALLWECTLACDDLRFHWWSLWFQWFHDPCGQCEGGGAIVWGNCSGRVGPVGVVSHDEVASLPFT
jgi:hypothetical protein